MPNTEPMSGVEMTRAVVDIKALIGKVDDKLDKVDDKIETMPKWPDLDRLEAHRDNEQKKQDEAIKAVEGKISGLMMAVVVASLGAAASLVTTIATSGL